MKEIDIKEIVGNDRNEFINNVVSDWVEGMVNDGKKYQFSPKEMASASMHAAAIVMKCTMKVICEEKNGEADPSLVKLISKELWEASGRVFIENWRPK